MLSEVGGGKYGAFPSTHWSLVAQAGDEAPLRRREALGALLERYLPALRAYLVLHKRIDRDRAEDLLQAFLADKVLAQNFIGRARRDRGKFRNFLLTALNHFMLNQLRDQTAKKRMAGAQVALDDATEPVKASANGDSFELAWAREVLEEAVQRMKAQCRSAGRPELWGVFESRVLGPTLQQTKPVPYGQLVEQFGFTSPAQASNALLTANRMFARQLRAVVAEYERGAADVEAEIDDLHRILARGGAVS